MGQLAEKTVLVTGASSGFGRAIALACAAAGANVALVARREAALQEVAVLVRAAGVRAAVCPVDVGLAGQIQTAADVAVAELGPIDVLVNNAGTNVTHRSIQETTLEEWQRLLDVNLTAAFLFTRILLPAMIARKSGTVINLASMAAVRPSILAGVAYSTAKIGMDALTQVTNEEGNPYNVRACLICPGVGDTPILDRRPAPPPASARPFMLQSEDIAQTVLFVAGLPARVNIERIDLTPTYIPLG